MALTPGARLGPYEILSLLGGGGMGEVYKGRDARLGRDVAIKVLPGTFSADPERLTRFEQEARAAAALNHPNIVSVHDVGHHDGSPYIVSELLDGVTLRDRLSSGPLPVRKAVEYAVHIARGLSAAHERGIVHRDLKPENIFITTDGRLKILDFGLAKLTQAEPAMSIASALPTSPPQTTPGIVLGTVGYVSPEQVRGLAADHRSDIFAFGAILYEMLSGHRAFRGETAMDTMTAILKEDPPDLPLAERQIPPALERIVERCVEKTPAGRFKSADDLAFALEAFSAHSDHRVTTAIPTSSSVQWPRLIAIAAALAVTAAIASYVAWTLKPDAAPKRIARFTIALPAGDSFSNANVHAVAISPDGSWLAYTANSQIYLRSMDRLEATPIRGTAGGGSAAATGRNPFFSADGRWIGFWQDGQLKKVSIDGGAPVPLCATDIPRGPHWTTDNMILWGQGDVAGAGIWRVSADGGTPEQVVKLEADQVALHPQMLPGGRAILFTLAPRTDPDAAQVVVQSLDDSARRVILERGSDARYLPTGHLVYGIAGTVFAVPFDANTLALTGGEVPVVDQVAQQNATLHFAVADQGTLVYLPRDAVRGPRQVQRSLAWFDRQGREVSIKVAPRAYLYPRLSPDDTRVAVEIREQPNSDIWILDPRAILTRLTLGATYDQYPVWTPDGRQVIFSASEFGNTSAVRTLMRISSDGTGAVEQLASAAMAGQFPSAITPDGKTLIVRAEVASPKVGAAPDLDLFVLTLVDGQRPRPLLHTQYGELNADISPDGRWVAYESYESGHDEVYVRPFPNVDAGKRTVSTAGGAQPVWSRNGKELFYVSNRTVMRVAVTLSPTLELGIPTKLFEAPSFFVPGPGGGLGRMYDVTRDGQRFLIVKESSAADESPPSARIILVQNWLEGLKARVPVK
jgi:serine/threonine-protein kinase